MPTYLDETGNLLNSSERYFIVATFTSNEPSKLAKAFRKWQKNKFPKQLKNKAEVKFNNPTLDDTIRLKTIQHFVEQGIHIFYSYLAIKNIPVTYRRKNKVHDTGKLYLEIVASTLDLQLPLTTNEFRVIRDQRTTKGMSNTEFNEALKIRLLPKLPAKTPVHIDIVDSTASPQVQIADWICGALARYYEKKRSGEKFFELLKPALLKGEELFAAKNWEK